MKPYMTASENGAILHTEGLTKSFGGLTAVDGVDFTMPEGQLRCLIGPNGAGKSTFFKLLSGIYEPDFGTIVFRGADISDLRPHERANLGLSLKFQHLTVYSNLTLRHNLRIPLQRHVEAGEIERRTDELLDLMKLQENKDLRASEISHGQRQWLEIAMAMAIEPDLLLLDEPTAGMTLDKTEETGDLIRSIVEERDVSVILTEHNIEFVKSVADEITVLHNGKLFKEGSVDDVVNDDGVKRIYLGREA